MKDRFLLRDTIVYHYVAQIISETRIGVMQLPDPSLVYEGQTARVLTFVPVVH